MPYGPTKIPTKGRCIYCGSTEKKLTDEHFLPFSLGGQHIIEKASCLLCADITKKFEQDVARELWGDARISYNAPSRRKKQRASHIKLSDPDNPGRWVKVPYAEYPAPIIFYTMSRAGFLEGLSESVDISGYWQFSAVMDDLKAKNFERKFGFKLTAKFRHVPDSFGRLLAKIGYGQVLCTLDPMDFRPICLPYILGKKKNISYVVGGSFEIPPPMEGIGYTMDTIVIGDLQRIILLAEIRLFANTHSPVYHVVVGDIVGRTAVLAALTKLTATGIRPALPMHFPEGGEKSQPHWNPHTWPLPEYEIN